MPQNHPAMEAHLPWASGLTCVLSPVPSTADRRGVKPMFQIGKLRPGELYCGHLLKAPQPGWDLARSSSENLSLPQALGTSD